MNIRFKEIALHNFKAHRDLKIELNDVTNITGDNARGKTTIIEAPIWVLYGLGLMGSKLDPTPTNYKFDVVRAEVLISVDDKDMLLGRGIEKGKATYYINEVPTKAKDFEELVNSLFDRDLFISLYNPSYFFTLHWEKQRDLLMRYVSSPASKEVLAEISRLSDDQKMKDIELTKQALMLQEAMKKHNVAQLIELHKKNKNDKDALHKRSEGKVEALEKQSISTFDLNGVDIDSIIEKDADLLKKIRDINDKIELADKPARQFAVLKSTFDQATLRQNQAREDYMRVYEQEIEEHCHTCKQKLTDEAVEAVKEDKNARKELLRKKHDQIKEEKQKLLDQIKDVEIPDISELRESLKELEKERDSTADTISAFKAKERITVDLVAAQKEVQEALKSRNDSIYMLDSIKIFEAKSAEIQAKKVQDLFSTLSVNLYKVQANGERKINFEIEMDGKAYNKLSLSESIKAGLELREVLSKQSEVIAPVTVDNSESVFKIKESSGQLILVKAIEDQNLKIELESV